MARCCGAPRRSVVSTGGLQAYGDGRVYAVNFAGGLSVSDAVSGKRLWNTQLEGQLRLQLAATAAGTWCSWAARAVVGTSLGVAGATGVTLGRRAVETATTRIPQSMSTAYTGATPCV